MKRGGITHPRLHIANSAQLQDYECSICYELSAQTSRCKGPCHQPICLNCITRIKATKDECPSKCSQPLQTEQIPEFEVVYQCPYEPSTCLNRSINVEQFWQHCKECPYSTAEGLLELKLRQEFRCHKGHQLTLMTPNLLEKEDQNLDFYVSVMNGTCGSCGWHGLCRATCFECSTPTTRHSYCVQCRKCPLKRDKCKQGHGYVPFKVKDLYGWVCDICGRAATLYSQWGSFDEECNIFICSPCFNQLPQSCQLEQELTLLEIQ